MILFFDTETTGLWNKKAPSGHPDQPRIAQLGALLIDPADRRELMRLDVIVYREDPIPKEAASVHGITSEISSALGVTESAALDVFCDMVMAADLLVAHNIDYDVQVINNAAQLLSGNAAMNVFGGKPQFCTMKAATPVCRFPSKNGGGGFGWPKLELAIPHLLGRPPTAAHSAIGDVIDCKDLFFYLQDLVASRKPAETA